MSADGKENFSTLERIALPNNQHLFHGNHNIYELARHALKIKTEKNRTLAEDVCFVKQRLGMRRHVKETSVL